MSNDSIPKPGQTDGIGDNQRGPQVKDMPVPFPPIQGDGDNARGATRPENIPAGMYGIVPPIGWSDSGIPGIFVNNQSPMYPMKPLQVNEAELKIRIVFPIVEGEMPNAIDVVGKVRFNQKKLLNDLRVQGPLTLAMDSITSAKLVHITCTSGTGTVRLNNNLFILGSSGSNTIYAFFNYTGGIQSVIFDGDMKVNVALFQ